MTKRVPIEQKKRPRRGLQSLLSIALACPFRCDPSGFGIGSELIVVAYRKKSIRLECRECGLRFSVDWFRVAQNLERRGAWGWGDKSAAIGSGMAVELFEKQLRAAGAWDAFVSRAPIR
jgi:hypothetical protein